MSIEKSNDLILNRNRDLPACSIVPQPTTLPRALIVDVLGLIGLYISVVHVPYLVRSAVRNTFRLSFHPFGATARIWALAYLHETLRFTSVY
jgi:hypothetical protein